MTDANAERERFEAWALDNDLKITRESEYSDAPYWSDLTQIAWCAVRDRAAAPPAAPAVLLPSDYADLMQRLHVRSMAFGAPSEYFEALAAIEAQAREIAKLESRCAFAANQGMKCAVRAANAERALAQMTAEGDAAVKDAERYRIVREHIDWFMSDENGIAGLAYSCQIQLSDIERHSSAILLDMICDSVVTEDDPPGDAAIAKSAE